MRPVDQDALEQYIDQYLFDLGYELVDFGLETMGRHLLLSCYVDLVAGGVSIKDCQVINDKLRLVLEADKLAGMDFRLIISSPGLDRVIKKPADFEKFQGRRIKVWFFPSEGAKKGRTAEGILEHYSASGTILVTLDSGESLEFRRDEAKIVRLVPQINFSAGKGPRPEAAD